MNKIILFLFLSFAFPSYSYNNSEALKEVDFAIHHLYNYDLDSSLYYLDIATNKDVNHPLIPFLKSSVIWLKVQAEEGYKKSYNQIKKSFNKSLPIYQNLIKEYPHNPEYLLYLGSLYGLISRIELSYNHWFRVLIPSLKGYRYIFNAYSLDSGLNDIYMPMGLVTYYSCLKAPFIKFFIKFMGIEVDCSNGLEYLEKASIDSYYSWIEASNVLTYIYLYMERDYSKALDKISPLVSQFPGHPFFIFLKLEALAKLNKWDDFDKELNNASVHLNHSSKYISEECQTKYDYLVALREFSRQNYNSAINLTTQIINSYNMEFNWLLGLSYYIRAQSYLELEMFDLAKKDLKTVYKFDFMFPEKDEAKILYHSLSSKLK